MLLANFSGRFYFFLCKLFCNLLEFFVLGFLFKPDVFGGFSLASQLRINPDWPKEDLNLFNLGRKQVET